MPIMDITLDLLFESEIQAGLQSIPRIMSLGYSSCMKKFVQRLSGHMTTNKVKPTNLAKSPRPSALVIKYGCYDAMSRLSAPPKNWILRN